MLVNISAKWIAKLEEVEAENPSHPDRAKLAECHVGEPIAFGVWEILRLDFTGVAALAAKTKSGKIMGNDYV